MYKRLEKIVNRRLRWYIEVKKKHLKPNQYGFRHFRQCPNDPKNKYLRRLPQRRIHSRRVPRYLKSLRYNLVNQNY